MIKLNVLTKAKDFLDLKDSWNILMTNGLAKGTIFQTFDWNYTWWEHLGAPFYRLTILVADCGAEIVGIMPLMYRNYGLGPLRGRCFEFLAKKVSNYQDIIVAETSAVSILSTIFKYLWGILGPLDYVVLENVPESSAQRIASVANHTGSKYCVYALEGESAWIVTIEKPWTDYLFQDVSKKFRYDTQRQIRRLKEMGDLEFYSCQKEEELESFLYRLFRMKIAHRKKMGEKRTYFEDSAFYAFDQEVVHKLWKCGWLYMHELRFNDKVIGANFDLQYNGRVYCHEIAYDIDFNSKFSPGKILQYFELQKAYTHRFKEFDFGLGDTFYKRQWANGVTRTMRIIMSKNPNLAFFLARTLPHLKKIYREKITLKTRHRIKEILR